MFVKIMSDQSDIELLYIACLEKYRKKYDLDVKQLIRLFKEQNVFENMIDQHIYLCQISFDEVFLYVENLIFDNLNEFLVYHGSCFNFEQIDLTKSHNFRDCSKGFYTIMMPSKAIQYANRSSLQYDKEEYYVYEYMFKKDKSLNIKQFDCFDKEYLQFIKENRSNESNKHNYDIIIAPLIDDDFLSIIQLFTLNILTLDETLRRLENIEFSNQSKQISFHTQKSLDCLNLVKKITIKNNNIEN